MRQVGDERRMKTSARRDTIEKKVSHIAIEALIGIKLHEVVS